MQNITNGIEHGKSTRVTESTVHGSNIVHDYDGGRVQQPPLLAMVVSNLSMQHLMAKLTCIEAGVAKQRCIEWFEEGVKNGIDASSARFKLRDPVSLGRMKYPARGTQCKHQSCFDAEVYIRFNRNQKNTQKAWKCPLCHKKVMHQNICIDRFVQQIVDHVVKEDVGGNVTEVDIYPDGTFQLVDESKKKGSGGGGHGGDSSNSSNSSRSSNKSMKKKKKKKKKGSAAWKSLAKFRNR